MQLLKDTIEAIQPPEAAVAAAARERLRQQARPAGSLGILEDIGVRLAGIFGTLDVRLQEKVVITCAGDHGICAEGISLFPQDVTPRWSTIFSMAAPRSTSWPGMPGPA